MSVKYSWNKCKGTVVSTPIEGNWKKNEIIFNISRYENKKDIDQK